MPHQQCKSKDQFGHCPVLSCCFLDLLCSLGFPLVLLLSHSCPASVSLALPVVRTANHSLSCYIILFSKPELLHLPLISLSVWFGFRSSSCFSSLSGRLFGLSVPSCSFSTVKNLAFDPACYLWLVHPHLSLIVTHIGTDSTDITKVSSLLLLIHSST